MPGTNQLLDTVEIDLRNRHGDLLTVYTDIFDNSLSRKWLIALNQLLSNDYHLEKNYCWFGFAQGERTGEIILNQVNASIVAINSADLGYTITDHFTMENTLRQGPVGDGLPGRRIIHDRFNNLHRYFEDLQGVSGRMSSFFLQADPATRWHIRQLNLLCHEFESWALSYRKIIYAPEWQRPSQLMCWLHAPRFVLEPNDYELFGIDTINRPMGGVFVGVNKAVGKHHFEVFNDEGRDSRIGELTTTTMRGQTEAAGDFDIEWGIDPSERPWQQQHLKDFRHWLIANEFDPEDKSLTIGHPQIGQVDLQQSFGTKESHAIWAQLNSYLDVYSVRTSVSSATYQYRWDDPDFIDQQVKIISKGVAQ
jgi:hypothetical protein